MRKIIFVTSLLIICLTGNVVGQSSSTFKPGWYLGANTGFSWYFAEGNNFLASAPSYFSIVDNAGMLGRLGLGYDFTPSFGIRGMLGYTNNRWPDTRQVGNAIESFGSQYLSADFMYNLSNSILGYNPQRLINISLFAGLGGGLRNKADFTSNYWNLVGRLGGQADFKLSEKFKLNLIADANVAGDKYNDYVVGFPVDIMPALALGFTYSFVDQQQGGANIQPDLVEKPIVEPTVPKVEDEKPIVPEPIKPEPRVEVPIAKVEAPALEDNIFYRINSADIATDEQKTIVTNIAEYLKKYPEARVVLNGYADNATGTAAVNREISKRRATNVANALVSEHGIAADRIDIKWFGSSVQPFKEVIKNRVVIVKSISELIDEATSQLKVTPAADGSLTLEVFYDGDIADIVTEQQKQVVAQMAAYLKANPTIKVVINGYADGVTGDKAYNDEISKRRAAAVANALIREYGIASDRISVKWFGSGVQPYSNWRQNRLVIMKAK